MTLHAFLRGTIAALTIGFASCGTAHATPGEPLYDITELPALADGGQVRPFAINDRGMVTGAADRRPGTEGRQHVMAFAAWKGKSVGMGHRVKGHSSKGVSINLDGTIVGYYPWNNGHSESGDAGFVWDRSGVRVLPGTTTAVGINDAGAVTGSMSDFTPYIWQDGVFTLLPSVGWTLPVAINNDGDVLANAGSVLVWHGGAWNDLGRMGGTDVGANAFNTHGTVVGWMGFYDAASDYTLYQAFVSDSGVLHYFGNPGWTITSEARAVNDAGVVVGKQVTVARPEMHAVVMYPDRAAAIDLNERLVPGTTGWLLTTAEGVNDRGQIVGIGKHDGRRVGYLLTPHH